MRDETRVRAATVNGGATWRRRRRRRLRAGVPLATIMVAAAVGRAARAGPALTTVVTFDGTNGAYPTAGLLADAAGDLYGTTQGSTNGGNGPGGYGTVFRIGAGGGPLTTLAAFDNADGATPACNLIADATGNLFGTTASGGANGDGTVFRVPAVGGAVTTLATFNGANGYNSIAGVTADAAGNLYGTTLKGGANGVGTVFRVPAAGGTVTTLAAFNGQTNGGQPFGSLTADPAGNLYGTTASGVGLLYGTVFRVGAGGGPLTTVATFDGIVGNTPLAGLTIDPAGDLFGTTAYGGAYGDGAVFELPAGNGPPTTVASFAAGGGPPGGTQHPDGPVLIDAAGDLYGTTLYGGANGDGTVYEVAAGTTAINTLATFAAANGQYPIGSLTADAAGDLYGTTSRGGASGDGTVFELTGTGFVVPEPAALTVLAAAGLPLLGRRWRASRPNADRSWRHVGLRNAAGITSRFGVAP